MSFKTEQKVSVDPIYSVECELSDILPDETVFCRLLSKEHLSYYIHKSLLNSKRMYMLIRDFNDNYHKNSNNKDYLCFCIVKTVFTNDQKKHYVFIEDLGKNK